MKFLISQEEIEELPEDPRQRFVGIESLCRERHLREIQGEEEWALVQESRLRYMSTVVSAAKYLKIKPVCDIEIPKLGAMQQATLYEDFVNELQFYIVQLMLEGAEKNTQTSVVLRGSTKQRLTTLLSHLRENVQKLDLSPARIDSLLARIRDFESELENPRLRFVVIAALGLYVAGAIADLDGATSAVRRLLNDIEETVGVARMEQDVEAAARIAAPLEARQLEGPRKPSAREKVTADLDDEIPF